MRTQNLWATVSLRVVLGVVLSSMLGACAVTVPPAPGSSSTDLNPPSSDTPNSGSPEVDIDNAQIDNAQDDRSAPPVAEVEEAVVCEEEASPTPLAVPENVPVFEKFNFQPQSIKVSESAVAVQTPRYRFSFCKSDSKWSVVSTEFVEEDYDYDEFLAKLADPDYNTLEINGDSYEYRIRLHADWLTARVNSQQSAQQEMDTGVWFTAKTSETLPVEVAKKMAQAAIEDTLQPHETAVYFEIKAPDSEVVSHQLYTLQELQEARLGASLGVPRIAGTVKTNDGVWFAATASQGEGDGGFASLLYYRADTGELTVQRPELIQGDQITAIAGTGSGNDLTLWLGTMRSGEGNPYFPADGLVAYQPTTQALINYTVTNSSMVGAIPHQLTVHNDVLWVGTGNGICQVLWQTISDAKSWDCWRFSLSATLPPEGVALYASVLAEAAATTLSEDTVEVLWAYQESLDDSGELGKIRYEVAYEPGFEVQLSQGGYRLANEVAKRIARDKPIFWPGRQWHWRGDRFVRGLDEVALNLVGGGPHGLIKSNSQTGFSFDHSAIRGDFDLISLEPDSTKVRYYSGWIDGDKLTVYPRIVPTRKPENAKPNPLTKIAPTLPPAPGP